MLLSVYTIQQIQYLHRLHWKFFHSLSVHAISTKHVTYVIEMFSRIYFCSVCRNTMKDYALNRPNDVENNDPVDANISWIVSLHNYVNRKLNKRVRNDITMYKAIYNRYIDKPSCVRNIFNELYAHYTDIYISLIHISEPTRLLSISYAVFCLKKKNKNQSQQ